MQASLFDKTSEEIEADKARVQIQIARARKILARSRPQATPQAKIRIRYPKGSV